MIGLLKFAPLPLGKKSQSPPNLLIAALCKSTRTLLFIVGYTRGAPFGRLIK
jgi:hypothetical protein